MPGGRKHSTDEVRLRLQQVAELYLQGWPQFRIAEKFEVSSQQITLDLKAIRKLWKESQVRDFDEAITNELAKIDNLELVHWESWQRSLQGKTKSSNKQRGIKSGDSVHTTGVEKSEMKEETFGDVRHLDGVKWCIDRRCKLLGLDAPVKIDATMHEQPLLASPPPSLLGYEAAPKE